MYEPGTGEIIAQGFVPANLWNAQMAAMAERWPHAEVREVDSDLAVEVERDPQGFVVSRERGLERRPVDPEEPDDKRGRS